MRTCNQSRCSSIRAASIWQEPGSSVRAKLEEWVRSFTWTQSLSMFFVYKKTRAWLDLGVCIIRWSATMFWSNTQPLCSLCCGWWLLLIYYERKVVLLVDWGLVLIIWCKRRIMLSDSSEQSEHDNANASAISYSASSSLSQKSLRPRTAHVFLLFGFETRFTARLMFGCVVYHTRQNWKHQ